MVSREEFARSFRPRDALAARARVVTSDARTVARVTRTVVAHEKTRAVARQAVYIPAGVRALWRYLRDNHGSARYIAQIDAAYTSGDMERAERLTAAMEAERGRRWGRMVDVAKLLVQLVKILPWLLLIAVVGLLGFGILLAVGSGDASLALAPFRWIVAGVAFAVWAFTISAVFLPWAFLAIVVGGLWAAGRRAGDLPGWLVSEKVTRDDAITPAGVAAALAHLGIAPLNKAIKDGWQVEFLMPPTLVNGRGYQVIHSIPMGVTPGMIADKRELLARNLTRAPLEVWPTAHERSGYVDMWVAHPGATSRAGAAYPLLADGTVDVFTSVPMGESQRGDLIAPPLMEASMGVGGLPGQGKSNAVRVIMAGAALDPLAELRVYVFAGNGDFDAYAPRLSRYRRGVDDSVIQDAVNELRELYREVERRETRLADLGAKKLSRAIASKHPDMRPLVVGFSEVHELFGHPDLGKEAGDLAIAVTKRQRKTGIFTVFDTQSSRAAAIPSALVELFKYNACFAVKTWRSNDGFLGDGSFQAGIRATELRPGKDRGTSLVTGVSEERFELLDWFYIEADDDTGYDAAHEIIARAVKNMKPGAASLTEAVQRDLLDDVYELMGDEERVRASEMAVMLRRVDPGYRPYVNLDGVRLAEMLGGLGVPVRPHKGYPKFTAASVLAARDGRGE